MGLNDGWLDALGDSDGVTVGAFEFVGDLFGWPDGNLEGRNVGMALYVGLKLGLSEGAELIDGP